MFNERYLIIWHCGCISSQWEMNSWVRHQVCLKFIEIHIECTIKAKGRSDGRYNLGNDPVQVGVSRSLFVKLLTTYVIDGLIVNQKGHITMIKGSVGVQDGVVWLDNGSRHLRCWVNGKGQLGFLPKINGETFHEKS